MPFDCCSLATSRVECYSTVSFTVVDCGTAPGVVNGVLDNPSNTSFGQTATYTCNSGYTAQGELQSRTCLANGQWSESDLVCEGKSHGLVH